MARKPSLLHNTRMDDIASEWYGRQDNNIWPLWLDDILSGVSRLDYYGEREQQIPLSTSKLITILVSLETIDVEGINKLLGNGIRMARRYMSACRIAYPLIVKSLDNPNILKMRYPQQTILTYEQGVKKGYDNPSNDAGYFIQKAFKKKGIITDA